MCKNTILPFIAICFDRNLSCYLIKIKCHFCPSTFLVFTCFYTFTYKWIVQNFLIIKCHLPNLSSIICFITKKPPLLKCLLLNCIKFVYKMGCQMHSFQLSFSLFFPVSSPKSGQIFFFLSIFPLYSIIRPSSMCIRPSIFPLYSIKIKYFFYVRYCRHHFLH